ncbi:ABC transporter ATP-binding protein, partial [Streptomyces monomycini]
MTEQPHTGPEAAATRPALQVTDLHVTFPGEHGPVHAVRGLSYAVRPGEVLGIVGESGSGKSAAAQAVLGLLPDGTAVRGSVELDGQELLGLGDAALSRVRGNGISMVFQDPLSALTPVYSIGSQLVEALRVHQDLSRKAARARAVELLALVGIPDPRRRADAFPHEFSGGMRQRAVIAMAIANDPRVIVADEPTTALDVTVQAQILDVLRTAREVTGAAVVLITHDLGVVAGFADRVQVMYAGRPVEAGTVDEIYYRPRMPYTIGLLGATPRLDGPTGVPLTPVHGTPPSLTALPPGCPFAPRCPVAVPLCHETEPAPAQAVPREATVPTAGTATTAVTNASPVASATPDTSTTPTLPDTPATQVPPTTTAPAHAAACHRSEEIASGALPRAGLFAGVGGTPSDGGGTPAGFRGTGAGGTGSTGTGGTGSTCTGGTGPRSTDTGGTDTDGTGGTDTGGTDTDGTGGTDTGATATDGTGGTDTGSTATDGTCGTATDGTDPRRTGTGTNGTGTNGTATDGTGDTATDGTDPRRTGTGSTDAAPAGTPAALPPTDRAPTGANRTPQAPQQGVTQGRQPGTAHPAPAPPPAP